MIVVFPVFCNLPCAWSCHFCVHRSLILTQFSEEVMLARDLVRNSIEKKLKEEAKLAK